VPLPRRELAPAPAATTPPTQVLATSTLRSKSTVLRYTAAATYRLTGALRLKASVERYDFSDYADELVLHAGRAGPF